MSVRAITHRYSDPLDRIWLHTAERVGFRVERSTNVYAHSDGHRVLTIGAPEILDADDCLAQMIFHELCHGMLEGTASFDQPDWGLENADDRHEWREHACLRLQARLTKPHGLRRFLAPTTDFRLYYDALPEDPLSGPNDDPTIAAAREGLARSELPPFAPHLERALSATAEIARAASAFADAEAPDLPSLYRVFES